MIGVQQELAALMANMHTALCCFIMRSNQIMNANRCATDPLRINIMTLLAAILLTCI